MAEKKEIRDLEELRRLRLADEGYIVITSGAHQATIHRVNAPCISTTNFRLKVSLNERKQEWGLLLGRQRRDGGPRVRRGETLQGLQAGAAPGGSVDLREPEVVSGAPSGMPRARDELTAPKDSTASLSSERMDG
jgi:hypothetical protein